MRKLKIKNNNKVTEIIKLLKREYPRARIILKYKNNWELLVATILSAQCTDEQVNKVTDKLFKKYKNIKDYSNADLSQFENDIRSTGFFKNKAKNIIGSAKKIISDFNSKVPSSMEELIILPGVARKTANVVLFNAFNKTEGIAVDTHVRRLSLRLGLSTETKPEKIEEVLMKKVPKNSWGEITYLLIGHGRYVCNAKKPLCLKCALGHLCSSKKIFYP